MPFVCSAQARLYLVAGTPAYPGQFYYPTRLYEVMANDGLRTARELLGPRERLIDVRDDHNGTLYLWGQNALDEMDPGQVTVLHEREPAEGDAVPITFSRPAGWLWGAVAGGRQSPAAVFGDVSPYENGLHQGVFEILADPHATSRTVATDWGIYQWFLYTGGINGGEGTPVAPISCFFGGRTHLQCSPAGAPKRFRQLGDLGPAPPGTSTGGDGMLMADTPDYLVIWPSLPPALLVSRGSVYGFPTKQLNGVEVLNKHTGKWTTYDLPAAVQGYSGVPVRMFGDWLATLETIPSNGPTPGAGWQSLRKNDAKALDFDYDMRYRYRVWLPDVFDNFYTAFQNLYLPGKIQLLNLADGQKLTLDTGQMDSEVLAIRPSGEILYRVYDEIDEATMSGGGIGKPRLLAKGEDVPEVHWAFWATPPTGEAAESLAGGGQ